MAQPSKLRHGRNCSTGPSNARSPLISPKSESARSAICDGSSIDINDYFTAYEAELSARSGRSRTPDAQAKLEARLAATRIEREHRCRDQRARHEIRVIPHIDSLLLVAEPAHTCRLTYYFDHAAARDRRPVHPPSAQVADRILQNGIRWRRTTRFSRAAKPGLSILTPGEHDMSGDLPDAGVFGRLGGSEQRGTRTNDALPEA